MRAFDGTAFGPWSGWNRFTVDLTAPVVGSVTSTAFPRDAWSPSAAQGAFTFTSPSGDVAGWRYWLDAGSPTDVVAGVSYTTPSLSPGVGWHVLHVQAIDRGFNRSSEFLYAFGNGVAITSPADGLRTAARVSLAAVAEPDKTKVRFEYRLPGQSTWTDLPVADVTLNGTALSAWPVNTDLSNPALSRAPVGLVWNVAVTRAGVDGPVEIRARFSNATASEVTNTVTVTLETRAAGGSYASVPVGPFSVTLVNGALSLMATDGSEKAFGSSLAVARSYNSLQASADGLFGMGWQSSLYTAGVPWSRLDDAGTSVTLVGEEGASLFFKPDAVAGTYVGVGEAVASGLRLSSTGSGAAKQFSLTYLDGSVTMFTTTAAAPTVFRVASVQQSGQGQTSSYTYDAAGRPTRILAPAPPGVTCSGTSLAAGCRATDLTYDGGGHVTAITLNTTTATGGAVQVAVSCFTYDAGRRLTQSWDPRVTGSTCGSPVLATGYAYDASGRLSSLTPPGQQPWTMTYDSSGRLTTVARTHSDASGTETTTFQYGAAIGAITTDAHPDLSAGRVAQWGQQTAPVTAVAVFAPGTTTTDLRDATIHAIDAEGREVDTATFSGTGQAGWKVDTTEYDAAGHLVRTLAARNRDLALGGNPSGLGLPTSSSSVEIARALDTVNLYAADGIDLVDSYGPLHLIAIDGGWVYARAHTHSTYGQLDQPGADPTASGPRHALVEQTVAASRGVSASAVDETDLRTTRYRYALSASDATGWTFHAPMATVTLMFGWQPDIVRETRFDPVTGEVVETRQPSAAGNGASPGTTRTTYYAAGPHNPAACVSSAWYGLACKVEPGAQPGIAGLPGLPVRHIEYDTFLRPVVTTETVVDAGGTTRTRTSTTTYENAGLGPRVVSTAVTGGVGTAVPTTTVGYDAANGLITTLSTPAGTTRTVYNEFGRVRTYTDADGATTTTSYGASGGRVLTIAWKDAGGVALGSQSIHYDGGGEHGGLATSVTDSGIAGGSITATYDADGALVSQGMPNGITTTATIDPTGAVTRMAYSKAGAAWFEDREDLNIHGQARWHVGPWAGRPSATTAPAVWARSGTSATGSPACSAHTAWTATPTGPRSPPGRPTLQGAAHPRPHRQPPATATTPPTACSPPAPRRASPTTRSARSPTCRRAWRAAPPRRSPTPAPAWSRARARAASPCHGRWTRRSACARTPGPARRPGPITTATRATPRPGSTRATALGPAMWAA